MKGYYRTHQEMAERKGTKALELWCKRLVKDCPNVKIENMTTSWRNGIAFCALVNHFRPDLIEVSTLNPENIYDNNQLAFGIAEKHLGIPSLLDPEDMVANEIPDRLSILTYLSQFYQRLGHTVNPKVNENDSKLSSPEPATSKSNAFPMFGKSGLDKCAVCDLPVYLAQRLIVAQKLYHRRCFRCSKCSGHLNPNNFKKVVGTEFVCENCKTDKAMSKYLNNNDDVQIGMLAFADDLQELNTNQNQPANNKENHRPHSILEKIKMFEQNFEKDDIGQKLDNLSLKETLNDCKDLPNLASTSQVADQFTAAEAQITQNLTNKTEHEMFTLETPSEHSYKIDIKKYTFLKTQLLDDKETDTGNNADIDRTQDIVDMKTSSYNKAILKEEYNITDDIRLANNLNSNDITNETIPDINITIPPRRKKRPSPESTVIDEQKHNQTSSRNHQEYPEDLNPFSEDEDDEKDPVISQKESTNPFGSSDDEDNIDEVKSQNTITAPADSPVKRVIKAQNPFWSDGEEPTSDENDHCDNSSMYKSSINTSTPNLRLSTPGKKKAKAPLPPSIMVTSLAEDQPATSMDDVASLSSVGSYCSTVHSDQKSYGKLTPLSRKKRPAPTPPESISALSEEGHSNADSSMEKSLDTFDMRDGGWRRSKGPAPGLPLPERREVKLQLSPAELQVQCDLLETQQAGLERQGVLIEQMIRDKCEGEDPPSVPQEEVEDLVIQLCELVNEKNDLFRKQTELMYIRRQQRLEQEQADIEHEIRIIQSRPVVNRIDADKAREEQLVSRLVDIVRLRDELVQQLDAERRREKMEDIAIAASIASRRAQRLSDSSSMKSFEVMSTPKKSKVKDKMKKQFKKAKHSLIPKKKENTSDKKEVGNSIEKENK